MHYLILRKNNQEFDSQEFRNSKHKYILLPQKLSHPFKIFSSPLQVTVSLTLLGYLMWAKLGWDKLPSCARKSPSSKGSFFSPAGSPWLPGLTQDFIRSLDLQKVPLSFLPLVPIVVFTSSRYLQCISSFVAPSERPKTLGRHKLTN